MLFEVGRSLALFFIAGPLLADTVGPLWHYAKHRGWLGDTVRTRHWAHHQLDYPPHRVAPADADEYHIAGEWDTYLLAFLVVAVLFSVLPLRIALPIALGASCYGVLTDHFHRAFHLQRNPLRRFHWYRIRAKRHRIHHQVMGNFGIISFGIDRILGTLRDKGGVPEDLFPGFVPPRR